MYPGMSLLGPGDDVGELLKNMNDGMRMVLLLSTIIFQWGVFALNYLAVYLEKTGLRGLGLKRIRSVDFAWGGAFFLAALLILSGIAWLLAQIGLELPGETAFLIPTDPVGRVVWVLVSFTAGFCEEVAFRGYLMTRIRLLFKSQSWILPTFISSVLFGACHAYQGLAGMILITVYGIMFALLYIRTGSLWPCIIAHFFQDVMYAFIPLDMR